MAVEARRLNFFHRDRGLMKMTNGAPMGFPATDCLLPMYVSGLTEAVPAKGSELKSDSGISYAVPVSRKRSRDPNGVVPTAGDISFQFRQQQEEIDRFIAQHTEKVRAEVGERWERYSRRITAAVEENILKKLKSKEEEIMNIGKINRALEERMRSLFVENQIWRDLAQANEATANDLRCKLEEALARVEDDRTAAAVVDDAQSSCGGGNFGETDDRKDRRMCRSCRREEASVLLLPCRHLCLCAFCGSSRQACPVCNSDQTASVRVNLSTS